MGQHPRAFSLMPLAAADGVPNGALEAEGPGTECKESVSDSTGCKQASRCVFSSEHGHVLVPSEDGTFTRRKAEKDSSQDALYPRNGMHCSAEAVRPYGPATAFDQRGNAAPRGRAQSAVWFHLCAVLLHHGDAQGGHYSTIRSATNTGSADGCEQWFHVSDETVQQSTLKEALSSRSVILFYAKM